MSDILKICSFPEMTTNNNNKRHPDTIYIKLNKADLYKVSESKRNMVEEPSQPIIQPANIQDALTNNHDVQDIDLIIFDDDIVNNNNGNIILDTSDQSMDLIDTLLCDPNFGAHTSPTQDEESSKFQTKNEIGQAVSDSVLIPQNKQRNKSEDLHMSKKEVRTKTHQMNFRSIKYRSKVKSQRKVYSFAELILYKFSPIAKEIKCDFSPYAAECNLLVAEKSKEDDSPHRKPGMRRPSTYRNGNGNDNGNVNFNGDSNDHNNRNVNGDGKAYVAPALRKVDEPLPFNLSFVNEFLEAQNRWVALMMRGSLVKKARNQMVDCKDIQNIISIHYHSKEKHEERCGSWCIERGISSSQNNSFEDPPRAACFQDNTYHCDDY